MNKQSYCLLVARARFLGFIDSGGLRHFTLTISYTVGLWEVPTTDCRSLVASSCELEHGDGGVTAWRHTLERTYKKKNGQKCTIPSQLLLLVLYCLTAAPRSLSLAIFPARHTICTQFGFGTPSTSNHLAFENVNEAFRFLKNFASLFEAKTGPSHLAPRNFPARLSTLCNQSGFGRCRSCERRTSLLYSRRRQKWSDTSDEYGRSDQLAVKNVNEELRIFEAKTSPNAPTVCICVDVSCIANVSALKWLWPWLFIRHFVITSTSKTFRSTVVGEKTERTISMTLQSGISIYQDINSCRSKKVTYHGTLLTILQKRSCWEFTNCSQFCNKRSCWEFITKATRSPQNESQTITFQNGAQAT